MLENYTRPRGWRRLLSAPEEKNRPSIRAVRRLAAGGRDRVGWSILLLLAVTAGLQAEHNKLLQLEFKRGISRHLARDSKGYSYLLVPSPVPPNTSGFTLQISRKPHPQSIADFSTKRPLSAFALPDAADTPCFSAGLAVDAQDRLHLVFTTAEGQTACSVVDTQQLRSGRAGPNWLNPVTGQQGVSKRLR